MGKTPAGKTERIELRSIALLLTKSRSFQIFAFIVVLFNLEKVRPRLIHAIFFKGLSD
jgi:hypothetical protein